MGKDSPAAPPPPDYSGAAKETAQGNLDAARYATAANRPNEFTPLGSRTWTNSGDQWQSNINLTPQGRGLFDQQLRISQNLGNVGEAGLNRVGDAMAQPFDMSRVPQQVSSVDTSGITNTFEGAGDKARDAVVQALMARQQPGMDRARQSREEALMTQGHNRGGSAWNAVQDDLVRGETDMRYGAELAGGQEQSRQFGMNQATAQFENQAQAQRVAQALQNAGLTNTGRQNAIQEQAYLRNLPLAELNALRTGAQPGMPQFQGYGQQQATPGANASVAAQAQGQYDQGLFNMQQSGQNQTTQGLYGLGGAALGGAAMSAGTWMPYLMAASDRRLKSNIVRVAQLPSGLPIYEYNIFGRREIGVMADEVEAVNPRAVVTMPNGYKAVCYALL